MSEAFFSEQSGKAGMAGASSMDAGSRREFLRTSAAIAALAGLASVGLAASKDDAKPADAAKPSGTASAQADKKLRILILGGTGFLGPICIESALARGHQVTVFNRGFTEERRKQAGRPSAVPDGVEILYGNRDPEKTADDWKNNPGQNPDGEKLDPESPKGLSQLQGDGPDKKWDAVIDTSGYWPRMVQASATELGSKVGQYVFISTLSVYAQNDTPGQDESAPLGTMADPKSEDFGTQMENYGPGKALCEQAAETAMPGRVTALRPGFIVGPRDTSKRFCYWPVRAAKGGTMLVPGTPTDPIQIIDVRDLADFAIRCIENKTVGVFNVTGPEGGMTMQQFVDGCIEGVREQAKPTVPTTAAWISDAFLMEEGVNPVQGFPLWLPTTGETAGFHQRSVKKAIAGGLTYRPMTETARATYAWWLSLPEATRERVVPTMPRPENEAELLAKWKKQQSEPK
jgi:2'-hydroxyisoflavone reductase